MPTQSIRRIFIAFLFLFITGAFVLISLETLQTRPNDIQDDINNKYTNVGNIQLTVTNYGTFGKGYCG
ncbi:MAG: hypothetical protein LWX07_10480 [Bacteroidetes bacterium]|nr:hypothetical protein [Bacteroidota bacterium]